MLEGYFCSLFSNGAVCYGNNIQRSRVQLLVREAIWCLCQWQGLNSVWTATTLWIPSPKVVDRNHRRVGCCEQKICDIVRGKWAQGMREAAKGLAPLQGQEMSLSLSHQCSVDQNRRFFQILEIIHPDLFLLAENAISFFPDGTSCLLLKIHLKITWLISMFQC